VSKEGDAVRPCSWPDGPWLRELNVTVLQPAALGDTSLHVLGRCADSAGFGVADGFAKKVPKPPPPPGAPRQAPSPPALTVELPKVRVTGPDGVVLLAAISLEGSETKVGPAPGPPGPPAFDLALAAPLAVAVPAGATLAALLSSSHRRLQLPVVRFARKATLGLRTTEVNRKGLVVRVSDEGALDVKSDARLRCTGSKAAVRVWVSSTSTKKSIVLLGREAVTNPGLGVEGRRGIIFGAEARAAQRSRFPDGDWELWRVAASPGGVELGTFALDAPPGSDGIPAGSRARLQTPERLLAVSFSQPLDAATWPDDFDWAGQGCSLVQSTSSLQTVPRVQAYLDEYELLKQRVSPGATAAVYAAEANEFMESSLDSLHASDGAVAGLNAVRGGFTRLPMYPRVPFSDDVLHACLNCMK